MAFNFNWSPLIADTSRARDMLTTALNKSPKPPIIVDDIIVTELNLGSIPPELEILEIGDLAEDKFRGIFKLTYTGDAFLTLRTRVQANPLNTFLSTKPSFASPQPLAASSGLTIPLQITLSDIKLSGFVILVFSKQKGITLVFRNDPLESLKVSSTFDSIPFVRDYLQKEIEGQLRVLFMEDLPAIIHRLSLRIWSPDYPDEAENTSQDYEANQSTEKPINPFASPPLNPFDAFGRPLDEQDLAALSSDHRSETNATFSPKNLLRLATLTDCHRTLSLFTPRIEDAVFRAWAAAAEREDLNGTAPSGFTLASLSRHNSISSSAGGSLHSFSETSPLGTLPSRPSQSALHSVYGGSGTGGSRSRNGRKRKTRVIDLRKAKREQGVESTVSSRPTTPTSTAPSSSQNITGSNEREGELVTPPDSPEKNRDKTPMAKRVQHGPEIVSPRPQQPPTAKKLQKIMIGPGSSSDGTRDEGGPVRDGSPIQTQGAPTRPRLTHSHDLKRTNSFPVGKSQSTSPYSPLPSSGSILEQAWMMKMANEIAKRVQAEREEAAAAASNGTTGGTAAGSSSHGGFFKAKEARGLWEADEQVDDAPPPAYAA